MDGYGGYNDTQYGMEDYYVQMEAFREYQAMSLAAQQQHQFQQIATNPSDIYAVTSPSGSFVSNPWAVASPPQIFGHAPLAFPNEYHPQWYNQGQWLHQSAALFANMHIWPNQEEAIQTNDYAASMDDMNEADTLQRTVTMEGDEFINGERW